MRRKTFLGELAGRICRVDAAVLPLFAWLYEKCDIDTHAWQSTTVPDANYARVGSTRRDAFGCSQHATGDPPDIAVVMPCAG